MPKLNDTLQRAVSSVFDLMEHGESPRSAILKTAGSQQLLPDQVTRLCQLYNRTATISQRLSPGELGTKLASAQVVDPREILKDLSSRQVAKQASAPAQLDTTRRLIQSSLATLRSSGESTAKQAASPAASVAAPPEKKWCRTEGLHHGVQGPGLDLLRNEIRRKVASYTQEGERLMSSVETMLQGVVFRINGSVKGIERDITAVKHAGFWVAENAPEASELFHHLAVNHLPDIANRKYAASPTLDEPPVSYVEGAQQIGAAVVALSHKLAAFPKQAAELAGKIAALREEEYLIQSRTRDGVVVNRDLVLGDQTLAERQMDHIAKVASTASSYMGSMMAKDKPKPSGEMGRVDKFRIKLQHPQHEATLRSVRARSSLQSLLVDDPVIAAHPEEDVVSAYNEISSYSPGVTENPATLRAVLRQYLANNSSSFDLSQVRSLERTPKTV